MGAPKAVDIPKLISHVVHINALKHNPDRGFEFTITHDNYPTILMDVDDSNYSDSIFKPHNFDVKTDKKKQKMVHFIQAKGSYKRWKGCPTIFQNR